MFIKKRVPHNGDAPEGAGIPLFVDAAPQRSASLNNSEAVDVEPRASATHVSAPPGRSGGGFGKFLKKNSAVPTPLASEKKGFFARVAKPLPQDDFVASVDVLSSPASKPEKPAKPVKPAKLKKTSVAKPGRASTPRDSMDVIVELEGNKRVAWRLSAQQFEEVDLTQVSRAASFSRQEQRFAADTTMSYGQAQDHALAEIGEEVRIVNASKQVRAIYATTAERIAGLGAIVTGPGLYLAELLLQVERKPGEELVCCVVLTGAQESRSLAVLYHFTKNDEVAATQITVNPDNLNFVLSQFAASRRLDGDNTRFVLFRNEDLLKVSGKLLFYPSEAMWKGISLRRLVWGLATGAAAAAALSGTFAGQAYLSKSSTQQKLSSASAQKTTALKQIDGLLGSSVASFAHTQGMELKTVTKRAGQVWLPGSRVVVDSTPDKETYAVQMPFVKGAQVGNNPSVMNKATLADVEPMLSTTPPEGCSKDVPQVSGGMNAVQITITCENPVGPLASYRVN